MEKIGKIRARNINELMKREGITQGELAQTIGSSQQRLSADLSSGSISEKRCYTIHEYYPKYDVKWLLGLKEHATVADELSDAIRTSQNETEIMLSALFGLAKLSGFKIEQNTPCKQDGDISHFFRNLRAGITISRDGKQISLSSTDLHALENKLCDWLEFELLHMIK